MSKAQQYPPDESTFFGPKKCPDDKYGVHYWQIITSTKNETHPAFKVYGWKQWMQCPNCGAWHKREDTP